MVSKASLEHLPRGGHCCLLYETPEQQISATVQFLKIGLERNERCLFLESPQKIQAVREALRKEGIDVQMAESRGALVFSSDRNYLHEDHFQPRKTIDMLELEVARTLELKFTSFRATGDISWGLGPDQDFLALIHYEKQLDAFVPTHGITGMCQYNRQTVPPEAIQNALETHKMVLLADLFCLDNLFYQPPEINLEPKVDAAARLKTEWMCLQLRRTTELQNARNEVHRQSNESFRTMVDEISDYAIYMLDPQGVVSTWNAGAQRNKGYTHDEIVGQHFSTFYTPEDIQDKKPQRLLGRARTEGRVEDEGWRVRKDGTRFWANIVITALHDPQGQLRGFAKITRDLTERRAAEESALRKNEELMKSRKLEAIGLLAGGIAHDFNNLLMGIMGSIELLSTSFTPDSEQMEEIAEIQKAGQRAMTLTRQLLAFSRRQTITPKPLNFNAVINELSPMLGRLIREDIKLLFNLNPSLDVIRADPSQIEQIILNLIVNARDAMPNGGVITVQTTNAVIDHDLAGELGIVAGPFVQMKVSDTGTGMTVEVLSKIFEPFFTTKKEGAGTGLGLATVHGIVKQNQGGISVASVPNQGTTFTIWFPSLQDASAKHSANTYSLDVFSSGSDIPRGSETILLVEDERIVANYAAKVLRRLGYDVHLASNAQEAIRLARSLHKPMDLLLTDVILPGTHGRSLADTLSAEFPATKLLYMSGYPAEVIGRHGVLDIGINFIEKPFNAMQLAYRVRELLDVQPALKKRI